jgi:hypothetical protein
VRRWREDNAREQASGDAPARADAERIDAAVAAAEAAAAAPAVAPDGRTAEFVAAEGAAAGGAAAAAPPFEAFQSLLHGGVAGPLAAVQASLTKDTTVWRRGILSTPCVVRRRAARRARPGAAWGTGGTAWAALCRRLVDPHRIPHACTCACKT